MDPSVAKFRQLMSDKKTSEWFLMVTSGYDLGLPLDVALDVQEAISLSNQIASAANVTTADLMAALHKNNFTDINKMIHLKRARTADTSRVFYRIVEWANDYDLPPLQDHDATFYRQIGIPRDIQQLSKLRFLLINEDYGITDIPVEIAKLHNLQGICIANNKIEAIPKELYTFRYLQRLDFENNNIKRVEDGIHKLNMTTAIDLSGNQLSYITPDVGRMPALRKMDIRNQNVPVDIMRHKDTPLTENELNVLFSLSDRIDLKY